MLLKEISLQFILQIPVGANIIIRNNDRPQSHLIRYYNCNENQFPLGHEKFILKVSY